MIVKMNEKISVIVPVYNTAAYLDRCIQSIVNQNYQNKEIVLVNDGSKDGSLEICKKWAKMYDYIRVLDQCNQGVSVARKNGVFNSTGELITFVDSDDELAEGALEILMSEMSDCDIVLGQVLFDGPWKWPFKKMDLRLESKAYLYLLAKGKIHGGPVARLFRKRLFDECAFAVPRSIACGEDFIMNARVGIMSSKVRIIPQIVYVYINHAASAVNTLEGNAYSIKKLREYELQLHKSLLGGNPILIAGFMKRVWLYRRFVYLTNNLKCFIKKFL